MEQLNKINQDKMLLKAEQNQTLIAKAKTSTKDTGMKATKVGKIN